MKNNFIFKYIYIKVGLTINLRLKSIVKIKSCNVVSCRINYKIKNNYILNYQNMIKSIPGPLD